MTYVIGVDTGGTFTDAFLADETGRVMAAKTSSTPPDFARGFLTAIGDLAAALGVPAEQMLAQTSYIVHGTTSTLNAIVTGDVAPVGFLTTRGHADSIAIMNLEGRYAGLGSDQVQQTDVADEASCQRLADDVGNRHGRVDGLVNNAAIFSTITMKPFWEISVAEWDTLMAVNLRGPWLVTKALLPALRRSPGASIVNVASDALWLGRPGYLHYVASKAGVYGLTHSMAHELGPDGIRVNTVSPGPVFTEIARETVTPQQKDAMLAAQAIKRPAGPQDMVGAVVFLLSDDSGWMTGQTLHLNGGLVHR